MKKHYIKLLSFFVCICLLFPTSVYAHSGGGGHFHDEVEAKDFWYYSLERIGAQICGVLFQDTGGAWEVFIDYLKRAHTYDTELQAYQWLYDNTTVDNPDNPKEYTITNELKNDLQVFVNEYKADLDSEVAYFNVGAFQENNIGATRFSQAYHYQSFKSAVRDLTSQYDFVIGKAFTNSNGGTPHGIFICGSISECGFTAVYQNQEPVNAIAYINWERLGENSNIDWYSVNLTNQRQNKFSSYNEMKENATACGMVIDRYGYFRPDGSSYIAFTDPIYYNNFHGQKNSTESSFRIYSSTYTKFRLYKSLNDLIEYQTNTVTYPYYMVTPTCSGNTITQSQIDNSVTYGDIDQSVTNIIIQQGGITEEQLQRIIDAILAAKGGGSDPVNPVDPTDPVDPSDPWTPPSFDLSGLLKGLMNLLAAIFGLISNLVGYVAQLIADLVTSLNSVIDNIKTLINQGVIGLFSAMFPFLPPEITSLLSLTFLLVAIIAVIKALRG